MKTVMFTDCFCAYKCPEIREAAIFLLRKIYPDITIDDNLYCCGYSFMVSGNIEMWDRYLRNYLDEGMNKNEIPERIIVVSPECGIALKENRLIKSKNIEVKHIVSVLSENIQLLMKYGLRPIEGKINIQYPCLLYSFGISRDKIQNIFSTLGLEIIESSGDDLCCGASGNLPEFYPDIAEKMRTKKIEYILKNNANIIITSCPACYYYLTEKLEDIKTDKSCLPSIRINAKKKKILDITVFIAGMMEGFRRYLNKHLVKNEKG